MAAMLSQDSSSNAKKQAHSPGDSITIETALSPIIIQQEESRAKSLIGKNRLLRRLHQFEKNLDRRVGIETQGVDQIPEEKRTPPSILNAFFMWWSMTMHVGTLQIGLLGPLFGLSLPLSAAGTVIGCFLGALCPSFTGTLGPKLGLRAVATARYSFGFWGAKICSLLNVTASIGFSVVNVVVCGQLLSAVSDYKLTVDVGIIIIQVLSYTISVFGFTFIHRFEKYSWVWIFVLLSILLVQTVPRLNSSSSSVSTAQDGTAGPFLSFLAINFSSTSGWSPVVADYYCNYLSNTPTWKVFLLTVFGIGIPTIFTTVIGSCVGELALNSSDSIYSEAFSKHGLGGLLQTVYHPIGFSKFSMVMLMFSVLGNNVVSCYSSGLSLQLLGDYFHAIPRLLWSLLVAAASAVLAMAGKDSLAAVVQNFVSLLGYWTVCFTIILLVEDTWFRRKVGYDISAWDQPRQLPMGIGAVVSLLTGYLAGGVVGMNQTWYVGPIAAKFGSPGGDVGEFLAAVFTCSTYIILRAAEKRIFGK